MVDGALGAGLVLAGMALGAFASGAAARHLAVRLGAPGTVLLGLGLELTGVIVLALLITGSSPGWLIALPLVLVGVVGSGNLEVMLEAPSVRPW